MLNQEIDCGLRYLPRPKVSSLVLEILRIITSSPLVDFGPIKISKDFTTAWIDL